MYRSNSKRPYNLYRKAADGTGSEDLLYADGAPKVPTSWSPDGRFLLFYRIEPKTLRDIWVLPLGNPTKPLSVAGDAVQRALREVFARRPLGVL